MKSKFTLQVILSCTLFHFSSVTASAQEVVMEEIASGFNRPCEIVNAGDERLFILEQEGRIKIMDINGLVAESLFLDITDRVNAVHNEMGLLGLAFPPDFCSSLEFYVNYTDTIAIDNSPGYQIVTRISKFSVNDTNPNLAEASSEVVVLQYDQDFPNHNGGHMEFGSDGYLYISSGDGGDGGDPNNNAQDLSTYLGKLLRIDVSTQPYSIPADNPFVNDSLALGEIWSYGLRNPWKFAFDSESGDLFIGDVGQSAREEVNYQPANSSGGQNYGWRCFEGMEPYNLSMCEDASAYDAPIFDYVNGNADPFFHCAVTGGRIYRGLSFPSLFGKYLFCDYCSSEYWTLYQENGEWVSTLSEGIPSGLVSFGEDVFGELYAVQRLPGSIYRVSEASGQFVSPLDVADNIISTPYSGVSYAWYLDGVLIDGENENSIEITATGSYVLEITSEAGCTITLPAQDFSLSSSDQLLVRSFDVFPNPTSHSFNTVIRLASSVKNVNLSIFSIEGKEIKRFSNFPLERNSIDVTDFPAGIYFIRLSSNGQNLATRKLVKSK